MFPLDTAPPLLVPPPFMPVVHSMHRRAKWHDYSSPGTYLVTITTLDRRPLLGSLVVDDDPYVKLSPLGAQIYYREINKIHGIYPNVDVWRKCVMPDHIHLIIHISKAMPAGKSLGSVIAGFKAACNQAYHQIADNTQKSIFEIGYNDKILHNACELKAWKQYIADNPKRLAIKRQNPGLFVVRRGLKMAGRICECIGNGSLLDYPDRTAVIVRSAWSAEYFEERKNQWLEFAKNGGVLVSAAINEREREVLHLAFDLGAKVIWLRDEGFPKIYKPTGRAFYSCAEGRLLLVSPWPYTGQQIAITRMQCFTLNNLAAILQGRHGNFR